MAERFNADEKRLDGTDKSHIFRYYCARGFVEPFDVVLDAACGYGYGSQILTRSGAKEVMSFDYSEEAIEYAKNRYQEKSVADWYHADLNKVDFLPPCDLAVSIETIEHLEDPERFAKILKSSAKRGIVISTPIIPSKDTNPHHLHDFTQDSIIKMFSDDEWRPIHHATQGNVYGIFYFQKA